MVGPKARWSFIAVKNLALRYAIIFHNVVVKSASKMYLYAYLTNDLKLDRLPKMLL